MKRAGFTLLELIIVFALFALIALFVIPRIGSYLSISINSASRDLASVIREAYNSTVLTKKVHRLVYDFKKNAYWVESASQDILLDTAETEERELRRKKLFKVKEEKRVSPFHLEKSITPKPIPLPRGVTFDDVFTQKSKDPISEGIAYTHIFPQGLAEQTLIHLEDSSEHKQSLVITPILGKTVLYERYIPREEVFGK